MQRIKLSQSAPGMVIARSIEAHNGQVLCAKGTKLSETLIARLEKLEISHVSVEGRSIDDGQAAKTLEEEISELEVRFQGLESNKLMTALKGVIAKHIRNRRERVAEEEAAFAVREAESEAENSGE
ncbi:MAG: hypothetical protein V3V62_11120 [bacterium]